MRNSSAVSVSICVYLWPYLTMRTFVTMVGLVRVACDTLTDLPATVSVVERVAPVLFARRLNDAVPLPLPDPLTVIQDTGLDALHVQPACVATVIVPVSVEPAAVKDVGETVYEQLAPACETVKDFPAMVRVSERAVVDVLAATLKPTLPVPLPVAPLVMVTQVCGLDADQEQPVPAVTVTLPVPPVAVKDCDVALIVGAVHVGV